VETLSAFHRARIFQEFDLVAACSGVVSDKGIKKFILDMASKQSDESHAWERQQAASLRTSRAPWYVDYAAFQGSPAAA